VMPVIGDAFSQWADTIDWTVRCDWLRVASVVTCSLQVVSFMVVVNRGLTSLNVCPGFATESHSDVVDQPDNGYVGVTGAGDRTAD